MSEPDATIRVLLLALAALASLITYALVGAVLVWLLWLFVRAQIVKAKTLWGERKR